MNAIIEIVLFTLAGAFLYFFSDWALNQIERLRGGRFEHRSIVFFAIIMVMALIVFEVMSRVGPGLQTG